MFHIILYFVFLELTVLVYILLHQYGKTYQMDEYDLYENSENSMNQRAIRLELFSVIKTIEVSYVKSGTGLRNCEAELPFFNMCLCLQTKQRRSRFF